MVILKLLRWLRGYVRFEASGGFVERFLNLLARNRIPVWSGRKRAGVYTGFVIAGDYHRMRPLAKKAGVRIRVTAKTGAPFQRRKYKSRTGLLAGLALFVVFIFGMSRFVWRIEVNGNERVSDTEILMALDRLGVSPGARRSALDVRELERRMLMALPELSWFALNIDGSVVRAQISESTPPPEMIDPKAPCNIVAREAGQILSMNVYDGQPLVQVGDTVLPGDIIVSGIIQDGRGQNLFRHARARVIAQAQQVIELNVPLNQVEYRETGKTVRRASLAVLDWELPLFLPIFKIPAPYHVERGETSISLFSAELPLRLLREEYFLMEEVPVTLTEEEAKRQALLELEAAAKARMDGAEVIDKKITGKLTAGSFILRAVYTCNMDIAAEKEIAVGE